MRTAIKAKDQGTLTEPSYTAIYRIGVRIFSLMACQYNLLELIISFIVKSWANFLSPTDQR